MPRHPLFQLVSIVGTKRRSDRRVLGAPRYSTLDTLLDWMQRSPCWVVVGVSEPWFADHCLEHVVDAIAADAVPITRLDPARRASMDALLCAGLVNVYAVEAA